MRRIALRLWIVAFAGVVALSIAAPVAAQNRNTTGNLSADGSVQLNVSGTGQATVEVVGTYTGTVNFEVSTGAEWVTVDCFTPAAPATAVNSTTSTGTWSCPVAGFQGFRARMASYVSGRADVVLAASGGGTSVVAAAASVGAIADIEDGAGDSIMDATNDAMQVSIVADGVGIGGGTQYTEGDTDATITGTALLVEGAANALVAAPGTAADGLLVNLGTNNDVTVSATDLDVQSGGADLATEATVATLALDASVDGVEALLTTIDSDTSVLAVVGGGTEATAQRVTLASDSTGVLSVDDNGGSLTVDGAVSCSNCSGSGASAVDDAAFTVATDSVAPAGALFNDSTPDSVNEGDAGLLRMSANRNLYGTIRDAAGNERGVNVTAGNALTVDGSASTQPVSATNLDVQSGGADLATEATVATLALDASVDGVEGLLTTIDTDTGAAVTSLQLLDNVVFVDDADWTDSTSSHVLTGGLYQSTPQTITDGDTGPLQVDSRGFLLTVLDPASAVASDLNDTAGYLSTVDSNIQYIKDRVNADTSTDAVAGTAGNQIQVLAQDFDGSALPSVVSAEGDAVRPACSLYGVCYTMLVNEDGSAQGTVTAELSATDNAVLDDIADGIPVTNAGTFATQVDGAALTALQLIDDAQTGDSVHYRTSVGSTEDEHEIKATAGRLFSVAFTNTNAAVRYWRCANLTAANTTPGTSTVFVGLAIPGNTAGAGFTHTFGPNGVSFSTALTCWFVTGAADSDVAEVAADEIKAIYTYK